MRLWEQICLLSLFQYLHRNERKSAGGAVCAVVANCFPNCQSLNKQMLVNFEGLSQDGGRAELTKNLFTFFSSFISVKNICKFFSKIRGKSKSRFHFIFIHTVFGINGCLAPPKIKICNQYFDPKVTYANRLYYGI